MLRCGRGVKIIIYPVNAFHKLHPADKPASPEAKRQFIEEKNRIIELNKQQGNTASIYTELGEQLGAYYDNYYKCMAIFEEQEKHDQHEIYQGDASLGKRALQRVLMKKQLEQMGTELREIMVYQSPPELGALWTEVEAMMKKVGKEQAGALQMHIKKQAEAASIKRRRINHIKCNIWKYSVTTIFTIYIIWLVWAIVQIRIDERPDLGRCLLPKGQWPYEHYNNLKWVDCEIHEKK